jgi:hypothetical protein
MKTDHGSFRMIRREQLLQEVVLCPACQRIPGGVRVTTTGVHLARRIGDALESAYKGTLESHYNREEMLLRVAWRR